MTFVLSAAQMRAVDGAAIERLGLPGLVLMENAGRGVAEIVARERAPVAGRQIRVVCGAGQNGGDGFVIARHLANRAAQVRVALAAPRAKIGGDAALFLRILEAQGDVPIEDASADEQVESWHRRLEGADVIVDAIFGTGLRSDVRGAAAAAISAMNALPSWRIAVDLPSGLDADTGQVRGCVVDADLTATMGALKLGLVLDAQAPVGRLEVVDLGVSVGRLSDAIQTHGPLCHWLDPTTVAPSLPRRAATAHKGTAGHLLLVAGAPGKTGAALLAARSALRTGAGLVTIASTRAGQVTIDAKVLEEMTASFADGDDADPSSYARLLDLVARMRAVAVGPGIPTTPAMRDLVLRLAAELPLPMVLDADALNLLGQQAPAVLSGAVEARVLTPHPGEMARLLGLSTAEVQQDRLGHARRLAAATGAVVVLKGARTVIASPNGDAAINPTANAALGTAGTGDVLTGAIGALLAQGLVAEDAARVGVYLHGLAADEVVTRLGVRNLVAGDLPLAIARVLQLQLVASDGDGHQPGR